MPSFKLTLGSTDIENDQAINIINIRPENNVSSVEFTINDYQSKSYIDLIDAFTSIDLSLKCKGGSYTKTFSGMVAPGYLKPAVTSEGEVLKVLAWGKGQAYAATHCSTSYGVESHNPTKDTAREIAQDLTDNYVEKTFGGVATNWNIDSTNTYVEDAHAGCSVTNLTSPYHTNLTILNRLCDIVNAWAQTQGPAEPSIHWFVDVNGRLYLKELDADHSNGDWSKYYGGSQTAATVTQGIDNVSVQISRDLREYANKIILACAFRKPAADIWTESTVTWGESGTDVLEFAANDPPGAVVGTNYLHASPDNSADNCKYIYYPSTHDANWDFTKVGSANTVPTLSFYVQCDTLAGAFVTQSVMLATETVLTGDVDDYLSYVMYNELIQPYADKWFHVEIPIGPYYALSDKHQLADADDSQLEWKTPANLCNAGAADGPVDWSEVNCIIFQLGTLDAADWYFDDLHFAGKIIREAYDAGEITATKKEHQKLIRLDTALDDTLDSAASGGDYSGTAARLATSELYRRTQIGITTEADRFVTGIITMPMKEDLLPGQLLHVHSGKKPNGTYRFNLDMRVKEVIHSVSAKGYVTTVNVTSDTVNTHAPGVIGQWGLLMDHLGALGHAEARDLKAAGIDIDVSRLSFDPTV